MQVSCPECTQNLEITEEHFGQTFSCPSCTGTITIEEQEQKPKLQVRRNEPEVNTRSPQGPSAVSQSNTEELEGLLISPDDNKYLFERKGDTTQITFPFKFSFLMLGITIAAAVSCYWYRDIILDPLESIKNLRQIGKFALALAFLSVLAVPVGTLACTSVQRIVLGPEKIDRQHLVFGVPLITVSIQRDQLYDISNTVVENTHLVQFIDENDKIIGIEFPTLGDRNWMSNKFKTILQS